MPANKINQKIQDGTEPRIQKSSREDSPEPTGSVTEIEYI
jgi:hypothetical protein